MDGRQTAFDFRSFDEEQQLIDGMIESLLAYSPSRAGSITPKEKRKSSESPATGVSSGNSSTLDQNKRGRGRPPMISVPVDSPIRTVSVPRSPFINSQSHLGSIIECLKRVNDQNKKLLSFVQVLTAEVQTNKTSCISNPTEGATPSTSVEAVSTRLEKIEQNLNSNILVCRGPTVESLIEDSAAGSTKPNFERLKGELCKSVCGEDITGVDIGNLDVNLLGGDRKKLKIDCRTHSSKLFLLKQARRKRPEGIYVSEFLSSVKLGIFYKLRQLKKQHPNQIQSVYTRGGNLFYRMKRNPAREIQVNSAEELSSIVVVSVGAPIQGNPTVAPTQGTLAAAPTQGTLTAAPIQETLAHNQENHHQSGSAVVHGS